LIYTPILRAAQLSLPSDKPTAPEISHGIIPGSLEAGSSVQIKVTVNHNAKIKSVTLFYRTKGTQEYKSAAMYRIGDSNEYAVTLGKDDVVAPGVEYYIQALDVTGNSLLHGYSHSPLTLSVVPAATPKAQNNEVVTQKAAAGNLLEDSTSGKKKHKTWLWITLGALAVGVIAAATSGGGGGGGGDNTPAAKPNNANVTVHASVPGGP
jgi:hypothetical protein